MNWLKPGVSLEYRRLDKGEDGKESETFEKFTVKTADMVMDVCEIETIRQRGDEKEEVERAKVHISKPETLDGWPFWWVWLNPELLRAGERVIFFRDNSHGDNLAYDGSVETKEICQTTFGPKIAWRVKIEETIERFGDWNGPIKDCHESISTMALYDEATGALLRYDRTMNRCGKGWFKHGGRGPGQSLQIVVLVRTNLFDVFERQHKEQLAKSLPRDADLVNVATMSFGIVTLSSAVNKLQISLEQAREILDRFVGFGEARKVLNGSVTFYDFPNVRSYLGELPNTIIELLLKQPRGMSRAELVSETKAPLEAIEEALEQLETKGIVVENVAHDSHTLKIAGLNS